jgi:hypothetical protein
MHSLAGELPRRHGYPSRNVAELEPHQAVTAALLLGFGHPNFNADLLCSTTTSLSLPPLSSLCFSPVARSEVWQPPLCSLSGWQANNILAALILRRKD